MKEAFLWNKTNKLAQFAVVIFNWTVYCIV